MRLSGLDEILWRRRRSHVVQRRRLISVERLYSEARARVAELEAELARVQRLPEQEWAAVGAIVLRILADAARKGYPVKETDAVAAVDRGKTYVNRILAERDTLRSEMARICSESIGRDHQDLSVADAVAAVRAADAEEIERLRVEVERRQAPAITEMRRRERSDAIARAEVAERKIEAVREWALIGLLDERDELRAILNAEGGE